MPLGVKWLVKFVNILLRRHSFGFDGQLKCIQLKQAVSSLWQVVFHSVFLQFGHLGKCPLAEVTFDFVIAGMIVDWAVGSVEREPVAGSSAAPLGTKPPALHCAALCTQIQSREMRSCTSNPCQLTWS